MRSSCLWPPFSFIYAKPISQHFQKKLTFQHSHNLLFAPPPPPSSSNFKFWVGSQLDFPLPLLSAPKSPRMSGQTKSKIMVMHFFSWVWDGGGGVGGGWVNKMRCSLCEGLGTPIWRMWCQLKTLFRNRWCALSSYAKLFCGWVHKVQ